MKKQKIYLDTSVISYLHQEDAPEKMRDTLKLWEILKKGRYEICISNIVMNEIYECGKEKLRILLEYLNQIDYTMVMVDEDTIELAGKFIDFGILRQKSFDDCQHIAAAILAGCDVITSWNFKHIVNVKTARGVKIITTMEGYKDMLIYPPSALIEEDEDDYE